MFLKTYTIVLTDGTTIQIKADDVEWCEKSRIFRLFYQRHVVARLNMDNIVGLIDTVNCMTVIESEVTI